MNRLSCVLVLFVYGCTVDASENPLHGCERNEDCTAGRVCDRGFCVLADGADGGTSCALEEIACNGLDDDCNEATDEFTPPICDTGLAGVCGDGAWVCAEGEPSCMRTNYPAAERCDGRDDDCDQKVDEGGPTECFPDGESGCTAREDGTFACQGTCRAGIETCTAGNPGDCEAFVAPSEEEICGVLPGADDDCDGLVDEGCVCTDDQACYGGPVGTAGVGTCRAGIQTCTDMVLSTICEDQMIPHGESCLNPGFDDDCDGVVDDVPGLAEPCVDETVMGQCRLGTRVCGDGASPVCVPGTSRTEQCDGADDDCDGRSDEGFDLSDDEAHCGTCGHACGEEETCCGGSCVDVRTSAAHCGSCVADGGEACGSGDVCCGGSCESEVSCGDCVADCAAEGRTCCSGACLDTENDEANCGECGHACGASQICCGGTCVGSDASHCGQSCDSCETGSELCCSGACVAIGANHCNACGVTCSVGTCCGSGCVDTERDPMNCGECGNPCPSGQACSSGTCCPSGQTFCDGDACRNLATDNNNCGVCGRVCGIGTRCCGGSCRLLSLGC